MSRPSQPPLEAVQVAADFLARALARDTDPTANAEAYGQIVGSLSLQEQEEAFRLARQSQVVYPSFSLPYEQYTSGGIPSNEPSGLDEGRFRVTVRYETGTDVDGDPIYSYRTALVQSAPYLTKGQIISAALGGLQDAVGRYGSDIPDVEPSDIEVIYEPFDLR